MLSLESLRYHCRTCLTKLEESSDEESKKCILIKNFPDVMCLGRQLLHSPEHDELDEYAPYICPLCLDKWKDFLKHYREAIKSDANLRAVLGNLLSPKTVDDVDECNEIFISTETQNSIDEIEKYDTISPFYNTTSKMNDLPCSEGIHFVLDENVQLLENDETEELYANSTSCYHDSSESDDYNHDESHSAKSARTIKKSKTPPSVRKIKRKYKNCKSANETKMMKLRNVTESKKSSNKKLRYHCEKCNKYFYEIYRYEGHVKQIHEGIQRPYSCLDCDKTYSKYKNLAYHIAENHSEKSQQIHKCEECDKTFKTNETLRQHVRNQHSVTNKDIQKQEDNTNSNKELTRIICDHCGFLAAHQYTLAQHIKNKHTEPNKIKCEHCPKIFKSQNYLKYHMLSHNPTNAKPFHCTECQMTFGRRALLNIHKRTHLKYSERIKCDFEGCDVRFVKPADKRLHMRLVHLKVKQHICDFCGEAFGAMQTLRHHRYIHTGEKPYKCNVCGQGFRQRTAMKTHRKAHFGQIRDGTKTNLSEIDV